MRAPRDIQQGEIITAARFFRDTSYFGRSNRQQFPQGQTQMRNSMGVAGMPFRRSIFRGAAGAATTTVSFSGFCNIKGNISQLDMSNPLEYVVVKLDTGEAYFSAQPMPVPNPPWERWYRTANICGDLVVP